MTAPATTAVTSVRRMGGIEVLTWTALDACDVDALVTTRSGGVSSGPYATLNLGLTVGDDPAAVLENRRRVAAALDARPEDFVFARQVHGADVRVVTAADRGTGAFVLDDTVPAADALVTADPDVVLAILAADCVPIVLYDPAARVLAGVHAGWRGTVARTAAAAVAAMERLGACPAGMIAGIGPAVAPDRYQVGADVAQAAERGLGSLAAAFIRPDGTGRWLFDVAAANRAILREAGIPDARIHQTPLPTGAVPPNLGGAAPGDGYFFSDRVARPCGRLALVARLRPAPGGTR
jgi:purine-nucleoside/S-methyl-5'-thioadenosine phosphorylase / adenosine deaminase